MVVRGHPLGPHLTRPLFVRCRTFPAVRSIWRDRLASRRLVSRVRCRIPPRPVGPPVPARLLNISVVPSGGVTTALLALPQLRYTCLDGSVRLASYDESRVSGELLAGRRAIQLLVAWHVGAHLVNLDRSPELRGVRAVFGSGHLTVSGHIETCALPQSSMNSNLSRTRKDAV